MVRYAQSSVPAMLFYAKGLLSSRIGAWIGTKKQQIVRVVGGSGGGMSSHDVPGVPVRITPVETADGSVAVVALADGASCAVWPSLNAVLSVSEATALVAEDLEGTGYNVLCEMPTTIGHLSRLSDTKLATVSPSIMQKGTNTADAQGTTVSAHSRLAVISMARGLQARADAERAHVDDITRRNTMRAAVVGHAQELASFLAAGIGSGGGTAASCKPSGATRLFPPGVLRPFGPPLGFPPPQMQVSGDSHSDGQARPGGPEVSVQSVYCAIDPDGRPLMRVKVRNLGAVQCRVSVVLLLTQPVSPTKTANHPSVAVVPGAAVIVSAVLSTAEASGAMACPAGTGEVALIPVLVCTDMNPATAAPRRTVVSLGELRCSSIPKLHSRFPNAVTDVEICGQPPEASMREWRFNLASEESPIPAAIEKFGRYHSCDVVISGNTVRIGCSRAGVLRGVEFVSTGGPLRAALGIKASSAAAVAAAVRALSASETLPSDIVMLEAPDPAGGEGAAIFPVIQRHISKLRDVSNAATSRGPAGTSSIAKNAKLLTAIQCAANDEASAILASREPPPEPW